MKREAASDGIDTYGFPFTFYDYFVGKSNPCDVVYGFKPGYFLIDISGVTIVGFLLVMTWSYLKNLRK